MAKIGFNIRNKQISKINSVQNIFKTTGTILISLFLIGLGIVLSIMSGEIKTLMISGVGLIGLLFGIWTISNGLRRIRE